MFLSVQRHHTYCTHASRGPLSVLTRLHNKEWPLGFFWLVHWEPAVGALTSWMPSSADPAADPWQLDVPSSLPLWPLDDTVRGTDLTSCARWGGLTGFISGSASWTLAAAHTPDLHCMSCSLRSSVRFPLDRVLQPSDTVLTVCDVFLYITNF